MTRLTNEQVLRLHKGLKAVQSLTGAKFSYAVTKNLRNLHTTVNLLMAKINPTPEFLAVDAKRQKLALKHAKMKKGKPVTKITMGVQRYVMRDEKKFKTAFNKIAKDHKKDFAYREKQFEDFKKLLKKKVFVSLHKIKVSDVPEDINSKQMAEIMPIIKE